MEKRLKLADRIWVAVALLHRRYPRRGDFTRDEIRESLRESGLSDGAGPGSVNAHLKQHLVANTKPCGGKYRMLYETRAGHLRLFRAGDDVHPERQSKRPSKHMPQAAETPARYWPLLDWYEQWSRKHSHAGGPPGARDALIRLSGSGKGVWAQEHADAYVNRLRNEPG